MSRNVKIGIGTVVIIGVLVSALVIQQRINNLGLITLDNPDLVIEFIEPEFEKAIKNYYDIISENVLWKDIGYRDKLDIDLEGTNVNSLDGLKWFINMKELRLSYELT
jgi:hypothetical protein